MTDNRRINNIFLVKDRDDTSFQYWNVVAEIGSNDRKEVKTIIKVDTWSKADFIVSKLQEFEGETWHQFNSFRRIGSTRFVTYYKPAKDEYITNFDNRNEIVKSTYNFTEPRPETKVFPYTTKAEANKIIKTLIH